MVVEKGRVLLAGSYPEHSNETADFLRMNNLTRDKVAVVVKGNDLFVVAKINFEYGGIQ